MDDLLLSPNEIMAAHKGKRVYDWGELIAQAQLDKVIKHRLDRAELRRSIAKLRHANFGCSTHKCPHWQKDCYNYDWVIYNGLCPEMLDQILALLPTEEEISQ